MMRLGLATPKSITTPGRMNEVDEKISKLYFPPPLIHMPDNLAPKEVPMLSDPAWTDDAMKAEGFQNSENIQPLIPGIEANFSVSPSHGSLLHGTSKCKPCAWFWKPGGCQKQQDCTHCHLCPPGEIKVRKNAKLTMMRLGLATPKSGPR